MCSSFSEGGESRKFSLIRLSRLISNEELARGSRFDLYKGRNVVSKAGEDTP
jgi:hypothetical protein